MNKVVLVDFDGVVLRNKVADAKVAKRAGIYTWQQLNKHQPRGIKSVVAPSQGDDICYNLYKGYGHTLVGLQGIGLNGCNMRDYNKLVYDTLDYDVVRKSNNNFDDVRVLINYCHECHYNMFMFSNAPLRWMKNILKDDEDIMAAMPDVRKVLEVDEDDENFLKPGPLIYDVISSCFNRENIVFIDDNIGNVRPVLDKLTWTNIVMSSANKKINNRLYFVDSLANAVDII